MSSTSISRNAESVKLNVGSRVIMKNSPPIKLKRTSFNYVKEEPRISCVLVVNALSENVGKLSKSTPGLNGYQRSRRFSKVNKDFISRSIELGALLNNVRNSLSNNNSSDDSSPVSINSDNIKTLISCVDNEFKSKNDKSSSETSDGESLSKLESEINNLNSDLQELNESKTEKENGDNKMEPIFAGHQLVGDSQLLRFAQSILGMRRKVDSSGKGWLGLCVGGQRICDLYRRVQDGFIPVAKKLIVLIGTNDLLKGTTDSDMCRGLHGLLELLFKTAEKIVILTLPPVPKIAYLNDHWQKLKKYNDFIFSLRDMFKERLQVIDISAMFYQSKLRKCHIGLFELWFEGQVKRPDLIHINDAGFKLMRDLILKEIR